MLPEEYTYTIILMVLFASAGGCLVRYTEIYKAKQTVKLGFLFSDIFIACFQGFFIGWYIIEHYVDISTSQLMCILAIIGYLGSKIFDIASYFIYKKLGVNVKFNKEVEDDSKRTPKQ